MSPTSLPRLTLARLLMLPVFAAVAMACIAMAERAGAVRQYGLPQVILIEAIVIPAAMSIVGQVIVRRGRGRDRLVAALLGASAMAAMVALVAMGTLNLWDIGRAVALGRGVPVDLVAFSVLLAGGIVGLVAACRALWPRIVPVRCPICGGRAMFPDRVGMGERGRPGGPTLICDACGASARRRPGGGFWIEEGGRAGADTRHPATIA